MAILGMASLLSDAFFVSMAVTIMGGLAFATILTLIAAPVLYYIFFKRGPLRRPRRNKQRRPPDNYVLSLKDRGRSPAVVMMVITARLRCAQDLSDSFSYGPV